MFLTAAIGWSSRRGWFWMTLSYHSAKAGTRLAGVRCADFVKRDSFMPWQGMEEYNIINGAVSYKKGQSGFSRTSYDTMVFIPEFYYKIVYNSSQSKIYYYVANAPFTGFAKHPGSGRYVGRYNTISGYASKSGANPLTNITRATARTNSRKKGSKWQQYDLSLIHI